MEKPSNRRIHSKNGFEPVNFEEAGYKNAAECSGNPESLRVFLEQIIDGYYTDGQVENDMASSYNSEAQKQVEELTQQIDEKEGEVRLITEIKIPEKLRRVQVLKDEIQAIQGDPNKPRLNFYLLGVYIILFLLSSYTLGVFYTVIPYLAFSGDAPNELSPVLLQFQEALSYNFLLIFIPLIMAGLGVTVMFSSLGQKWWNVGLRFSPLVLAVLLFNVFLGQKVLDAINHKNLILNLPPMQWFQSVEFMAIVFIGTILYFIWNMLLFGIFNERHAKHSRKWFQEQLRLKSIEIEGCETSIDILKLKKSVEIQSEIIRMRKKLDELKKNSTFVPSGSNLVVKSIDDFGKGWISFLKFDNDSDVRDKCNYIISEYKSKIK